MNKPAKTAANVAAGAKSRYDDFVVTHIQQTNSIHNTVRPKSVPSCWKYKPDRNRPISSLGTVTTRGLTRPPSAMSAVIKATSQ